MLSMMCAIATLCAQSAAQRAPDEQNAALKRPASKHGGVQPRAVRSARGGVRRHGQQLLA